MVGQVPMHPLAALDAQLNFSAHAGVIPQVGLSLAEILKVTIDPELYLQLDATVKSLIVVISPLISLMGDQTMRLSSFGLKIHNASDDDCTGDLPFGFWLFFIYFFLLVYLVLGSYLSISQTIYL